MRLLIIEDDRDAADYLVKAFREAGHIADHAGDGEEGLQLALDGDYDVLIVDRMLPKRDGLSVIGALRAKSVEAPVLILSALGQVDDRVKGLRTGGDDYLAKPYAFSELLARVEALGRRRGLAFQSTGLGAVQNIHWSASEITEPSSVLPVQHPLRRLFHLELLKRGYYIAQRGMVNLSLPVTTGDLAGFLEAADAVLALHADLLPKAGTTIGPAGKR